MLFPSYLSLTGKSRRNGLAFPWPGRGIEATGWLLMTRGEDQDREGSWGEDPPSLFPSGETSRNDNTH
jgi:hypothetical protein